MPYADKAKQRKYVRLYMRRKRAENHKANLIKSKAQLQTAYDDSDAFLRLYDPERKWLKEYDEKIQRCDAKIEKLNGLLQNPTELSKIGDTR